MSKRTSSDQSSLSSWVIKRPNVSSVSTTIDCNKTNKSPNCLNEVLLDSLEEKQTSKLNDDKINNLPPTTSNLNEFTSDISDIGYFLKNTFSKIPDEIKVKLLELPNVPKDDFVYPFSIHIKKNKEERRFLNRSHFEKYKWLVYSYEKNGVFCKYCVLFSNKGGKDRATQLNKLVKEPLNKYAKILGKDGDFEVHSKNQYHIDSIQIAEDFLLRYKNPHKEVINIINTDRLKQIEENRKRLKPIIETIIFLGHQNIPLRGHYDSGHFYQKVNSLLPTTSDMNSTINKGNFRELLKLRISCGDSDLEKHLKSTHSKATYISPVIQNDIIECCKIYITEEIVKEIHESKYYSILFDETTDISHISQMSLIIRYPYKGIIKECFMGFINCHDIYDATATDDDTIEQVERNPETFEPKLTGDILGEVVVNMLKSLTLNLKNCVGIGTDGCAVMVSIARGAVKKVQSHATNALHCPCSNHALNLSISKSSNVQVIRNTIGIVTDVISFFNLSSKRNFVLKKVLNHKPHLKSLCETRWVERHDCIMIFKSSLSDIVESLSLISNWQEQISSSKAKILLSALCTCEFINGLQCLSSVLCVTSKISKLLQAEWQDVCQTKEIITDVINNLEEKRKNSIENFHELYIETKEIMLNLEVEEKLPRLTGRQTKRPNYPVSSVEEYYRVSVYIPLVENILNDMKERFNNEKNQAFLFLSQLTPKNIIKTNNDDIVKVVDVIKKYYTFEDMDFIDLEEINLKTEINLWKSKWIRIKDEGILINNNLIC